jgi:hypothetical protein
MLHTQWNPRGYQFLAYHPNASTLYLRDRARDINFGPLGTRRQKVNRGFGLLYVVLTHNLLIVRCTARLYTH